MAAMFEQLGLIGCGLMGGSFALAMKRAGLVKRVVGYSKSPSTTERARQMGVIDVEAPSALLAVSGADIVLLAVPVSATEATFKAIRHLITGNMLIMDVGSTKRDVIDSARRVLRDHIGSFVPCHPVTGKEASGVEHADPGQRGQRVLAGDRAGRAVDRRAAAAVRADAHTVSAIFCTASTANSITDPASTTLARMPLRSAFGTRLELLRYSSVPARKGRNIAPSAA